MRETGVSGLAIACAMAAGAANAAAQSGMEPAGEFMAPPVIVTATRVEQSSFALPVSVDGLDAERIQQQQARVNLSESLARVPGIIAQNRQNYAQDLQVSSRGYGARSTFGIRGIRLYADGIPATMPDGQGQASNFDLGSAGRIEVMRGPFSALYGNSSGGVISLFTEDGMAGTTIEGDASFGSFDTRRNALKASGDNGTINYTLSGSQFHTSGYRDHSAATRDIYNARLQGKPDESSKLTFVFNSLDMPEAQDALGLTRAQFAADPRQAGTGATPFNTRKQVMQSQGGVNYERSLTPADTLTTMIYYGRRNTTQFQAIPVAAQIPATSAGGVIDLVRDYGGIDLHWTRHATLGGTPLRFTAGLAYENMDERRRGFENFTGPSATPVALGVQGALRRDEDNRAFTFDQYLQAEWQAGVRWLLLAGVRNSAVKVRSRDHYGAAGNGNDSGSTQFSATNPVVGLIFRATDALNLYASYGRGFETPTLNELSYRRSGSGLNFGLKAATSNHLEIGAKALLGQDAIATAAVFHATTRNEIAVLTNTGGRAIYQNVGGTTRDGLELAIDAHFAHGFAAHVAYAYLKAVYADAFFTCSTSPCAAPNVPVPAGNAIPGVPRSTLYGELAWKHAPSGFSSGVELRHMAQTYVNDVNDDAAAAYTVANAHCGFEQVHGAWRIKEFLRIDNLTGRRYAGSVIVNEGNSRYFEPAPGRTYLAGASLAYLWR